MLPKLGTKNALFGFFWGRISKNYCLILNQHTQICLIQKILRKKKKPKFGTKNASFWVKILKNYGHVRNQHHQICLSRKFHEKTKIP